MAKPTEQNVENISALYQALGLALNTLQEEGFRFNSAEFLTASFAFIETVCTDNGVDYAKMLKELADKQ